MIFYVFVDGIGFGRKDSDTNPFTRYSRSIFLPLGDLPPNRNDLIYKTTDASMGVPGLPQSATGQTSLWTGLNGPKSVKRHINGFPTFTLKKIISKFSMVKILHENGMKADLLNAYTPYYFETIGKNPRFQSASTLIQKASGRSLKNLEDLRNGNGIYMDITHSYLREVNKGFLEKNDPLLEVRDPYVVGKSLPSQFGDYDLAIFEYFITDKAGHDRNWEVAKKSIEDLENFLEGFLDGMDPNKDSLILTSDHGNMEDLNTDRHTINPVPTIISGAISQQDSSGIHSLMDIPPFIYSYLNLESVIKSINESEFQVRL